MKLESLQVDVELQDVDVLVENNHIVCGDFCDSFSVNVFLYVTT